MAVDWTSHNSATPRSTVGFFYPPSSPTHVNFPPNDPHVPFITGKTPPIPSLPTLSAYNLHANINPHPTNSNEKFPNPPPPHPPSSPTPPPTSTPFPWRMILIFIALIPLPTLLSAIYVILGAALLSLPASLAASGAIGGVITTIPLVAGVYFLISPWSPPPPPEDFFDDTSSTTRRRYLKVEYLACVLLAISVGAFSAPIGAACLSQDAGNAAKAGVLGGIVLFVGLLALGCIGLFGWWMHTRQRLKRRSRESST